MDPRTLWVRMRVDQGRSAGLVAGLPARITLRSRPGVVLNGHVVRVESLADSVTEERIAQVALELPSGETVSVPAVGELAEVTLNLPATSAGPWVSNASIQRRQGQPGVWRLQDGRPQFVLVRLGVTSLDGQVQVLQGLQVGDSVVVHSQTPLQEGQRVRIEPQLAKSAATP
jgi:HlyD family secretion protein